MVVIEKDKSLGKEDLSSKSVRRSIALTVPSTASEGNPIDIGPMVPDTCELKIVDMNIDGPQTLLMFPPVSRTHTYNGIGK